ncbi:hypothetical protein OAZ97_00325 [Prochlorococcus sp. AH-736-E15]|nr:hypothetical protein [Prochlorococcus sp. AH-736-E15]
MTIKKLKDIGNLKELSDEIFPYIDGIFKVNESEHTFDEMPHEVKTLSDFLLLGNEDDFIEIVEYEDG